MSPTEADDAAMMRSYSFPFRKDHRSSADFSEELDLILLLSPQPSNR